ncbi:hypothetical protein ACOI1C_18390 [Bacillus sp. DJP31]|uniref:hypothetical protein n=1 Tax=Bacillus sp. DJP31 TaxID=3409789 RepID=UPI003BB5054F
MGIVVFLFLIQLGFLFYTYLALHARRWLFDDRFGKTYTFATTGVSGFVLGMMLIFLLQPFQDYVALGVIVLGGLIGILFGSLYKTQTVLSGFWNGSVGGLMGAMLGLVVLDPALCGLPGVAARDIIGNILMFSIFGTIVLVVTLWLVKFSLRV